MNTVVSVKHPMFIPLASMSRC